MYRDLQFFNQPILKKWLQSSNLFLVCYISFAAFVTYSCMYGFRKPYTVGLYNHQTFMGISYKVCLVIAQVLGYMFSKFYGIKFISSMNPSNRSRYILIAIFIAWLSLFLFALTPAPYNIFWLFINGLPLGIIFGLVFGFLEGRRTTEIMGAFLAVSFIFSSGLAKSVGKYLLIQIHVTENWMPFIAGSIFVLPLLISVFLLQLTPPPTDVDIQHRTVRNPMTKEERNSFLKLFGKTIIPVVISYAIFTIVRDFTEDFANELWIETGYQNKINIFAQLSTFVSIIVLIIISSFFLIKDNFKAFSVTHLLVIFGIVVSVTATILFNLKIINALIWMTTATTGLYLSYLPFNCMYFERFLSAHRVKGNVGFLMYIADSFGYLGTVIVLLIKEFVHLKTTWVHLFSILFYFAGFIGIFLIFNALVQHQKLFKQEKIVL